MRQLSSTTNRRWLRVVRMCDENPFDPFEEENDLEPPPLWIYEDEDMPWRVANDGASRTIQS
jgi:hypothetical protein